MAKISSIEKNKKRRKLANKFYPLREKLRNASVDMTLSDEEREKAALELQKLPRNTSHVRVRNRCIITGRPRGVYSDFRLSRNKFRELALKGMIPGITKASW